MSQFPLFLSAVFVVHNQADRLEDMLQKAISTLSSVVADYEIIIVDNASNDDSVEVLKRLTGQNGLPNLQVYALIKGVDIDTASWVGLENALGDFVAVVDPAVDDIAFLPDMLEQVMSGADVVFARNTQKPQTSIAYRVANSIFNSVYKACGGVHLGKDAPRYRILSKRVVNFILQHSQPAVTYRYLPATGGFTQTLLGYRGKPLFQIKKRLGESIDCGMRLLVSTTQAPMRLVTSLSLFGAVTNLLYSIYVLVIAAFKSDVAAGWVSMSLQQSGMFFLISLVLLVLGEYILSMASLSNEGPLYHVGQEFTSARMTRLGKLNIEDVSDVPKSSLHSSYK